MEIFSSCSRNSCSKTGTFFSFFQIFQCLTIKSFFFFRFLENDFDSRKWKFSIHKRILICQSIIWALLFFFRSQFLVFVINRFSQFEFSKKKKTNSNILWYLAERKFLSNFNALEWTYHRLFPNPSYCSLSIQF